MCRLFGSKVILITLRVHASTDVSPDLQTKVIIVVTLLKLICSGGSFRSYALVSCLYFSPLYVHLLPCTYPVTP